MPGENGEERGGGEEVGRGGEIDESGEGGVEGREEAETERLRQEVALLMGMLRVEEEGGRGRKRSGGGRRRKWKNDSRRPGNRAINWNPAQSQQRGSGHPLFSLHSLKDKLREKERREEELREEKRGLGEARDAWQRRYEELAEEVEVMRAQVREAGELSSGIGRLMEGSGGMEMKQLRETHRREVEELRKEIEESGKTIAAMREEMEGEVMGRVEESKRAEEERLSQAHVQQLAEINRWRGEAARYQQLHAAAERSIESLSQRLRDLTSQLEQSNAELAAQRQRMAEVEANGREMEVKVRLGGGEVREEREAPMDPSLLSVMKEELASAKAVNERLLAAHQQQSVTINELRDKERDNERLSSRLQHLSAQYEDLQRQLAEGQQAAEGKEREARWEEEKAQLVVAMQSLTTESRQRERLLVEREEEIARLKEERERVKQAMEEEKYASPAPSRHFRLLHALLSSAASIQPCQSSLRTSSTSSRPPSAFSSPISSRVAVVPAPTSAEVFTPAVLDQLADRLAVKLNDRVERKTAPSNLSPLPLSLLQSPYPPVLSSVLHLPLAPPGLRLLIRAPLLSLPRWNPSTDSWRAKRASSPNSPATKRMAKQRSPSSWPRLLLLISHGDRSVIASRPVDGRGRVSASSSNTLSEEPMEFHLDSLVPLVPAERGRRKGRHSLIHPLLPTRRIAAKETRERKSAIPTLLLPPRTSIRLLPPSFLPLPPLLPHPSLPPPSPVVRPMLPTPLPLSPCSLSPALSSSFSSSVSSPAHRPRVFGYFVRHTQITSRKAGEVGGGGEKVSWIGVELFVCQCQFFTGCHWMPHCVVRNRVAFMFREIK